MLENCKKVEKCEKETLEFSDWGIESIPENKFMLSELERDMEKVPIELGI